MTLGKGFLNNLCVSEIGRCKHNNSVAMALVMETAAGFFFSLCFSKFQIANTRNVNSFIEPTISRSCSNRIQRLVRFFFCLLHGIMLTIDCSKWWSVTLLSKSLEINIRPGMFSWSYIFHERHARWQFQRSLFQIFPYSLMLLESLSLSLSDAFSTRKIFQKILQVLKRKGSVAFGLKIVVMAKCYECYHQYVD